MARKEPAAAAREVIVRFIGSRERLCPVAAAIVMHRGRPFRGGVGGVSFRAVAARCIVGWSGSPSKARVLNTLSTFGIRVQSTSARGRACGGAGADCGAFRARVGRGYRGLALAREPKVVKAGG